MTIYLIIAAVDFMIGLLALSKRGIRGVFALALISFSACIWSIELFLFTYVQNKEVLDLWFHLTRIGMFLIPPSLALLVWQLVAPQSRIFRNAIVVPGFSIGILLYILNNTLLPSDLKYSPAGYLPEVDFIYYTFGASFLLCLLGSIALTALAFRSAAAREKQRIQWLLITLVTSFCCGLASITLISYDFYLSKFIGGTTNVVFMLLLFYSTVAHHLMDFKLAASLAVSRILLLVFFACLYFATAPAIADMPGPTAKFALLLALFMIMLELYPRILKWLEPNTRRLLASQTYDYQKVVDELRDNMRNCNDMNHLSRLLNYVFYNVLRVKEYHLCLLTASDASGDGAGKCQATSISDQRTSIEFGGELFAATRSSVVMVDETQADIRHKLMSLSAACFFPVFWEGQLRAVMLVGRPINYSFFRYDDIRLMEWMMGELAMALQRIDMLDKLHSELAEAKKKLSLLSVMNLYHHDIKAPLSIIDGVISNDLYDEEKRRQVILEQVAWGSQLITTMANLLNGGRRITVETVDIEEVLRDCTMVFRHIIPDMHCHFGTVPSLKGDPEDLKILFINVLKNAHEAARPGIALILRVTTWTDNNKVYVAIADNGAGMNPDQLSRLWQGLESSKKGGNGIGLQTIKRIADEHGATIEVKSTPDTGTTFTFGFPLPSRTP
jgi:signal transduction histidine kinase